MIRHGNRVVAEEIHPFGFGYVTFCKLISLNAMIRCFLFEAEKVGTEQRRGE